MSEDLFAPAPPGPDDLVDMTEAPLPTVDEARLLWDRFGMLDNIRAHSEKVCLVAMTLTDWLEGAGIVLRRQAVEVGALLHDIAKTACLGTDRRHDQEGLDILNDLGYPQLGRLVARHVFLPPGSPLDEIMVVNYADKRVKHDQIVGLDERYQYIMERYGNGDPVRMARIEKGYGLAQVVEQTVFKPLTPQRTPADVFSLEVH